MFDLFNSQKAKKYVMGGILVLVSLSMLLYLVPNYNTGSGVSDVIVAKIAARRSPKRKLAGRSRPKPGAKKFPRKSFPTMSPR